MTTISVVLINNGDTEPEVWAFEDAEQADTFAGVRGSCIDIHVVEPLSYDDAAKVIAQETKDRRDDERCRQAGL